MVSLRQTLILINKKLLSHRRTSRHELQPLTRKEHKLTIKSEASCPSVSGKSRTRRVVVTFNMALKVRASTSIKIKFNFQMTGSASQLHSRDGKILLERDGKGQTSSNWALL